MKYFKRYRPDNSPFFIDERGKVVDEKTARTNLVESGTGQSFKEYQSFRESASDTAAAKTLVGHFVKDRNAMYGPDGLYRVGSVDEKTATLHGPLGKGGMKTISHKELANGYADMGSEAKLDQPQESWREKMETALTRSTNAVVHRQAIEEAAVIEDLRHELSGSMGEAFRRFLPAQQLDESAEEI